jgi:hypothetical protein
MAANRKRTMVTAIGVKIAAYIITRMLELLSRHTTKTIIKVMGHARTSYALTALSTRPCPP